MESVQCGVEMHEDGAHKLLHRMCAVVTVAVTLRHRSQVTRFSHTHKSPPAWRAPPLKSRRLTRRPGKISGLSLALLE